MTEKLPLFKCTSKQVHEIADRLNNMLVHKIPDNYHEQYGAGWMLKLQGDIIATAVEWCYRDFITELNHVPTPSEIEKAWYDYTYFDLFDSMGLAELRPPKMLENSIMYTYAIAMTQKE